MNTTQLAITESRCFHTLKYVFIFYNLYCASFENDKRGRSMSNIEHPDYQTFKSEKNIEIRDYCSMIFAEVEVVGPRKQAIGEGFRILADYIFGNNISTLLTGELGEKIAMTSPVIQEKYMNNWKVKFIMPKKYDLETLPKPHSEKIRLVSFPAKRFAVIRFSGLVSDENIKQHTEELRNYCLAEKLLLIGDILLAFYNPPWTLPFLRRNEIMIEIGTHQ